MAFLVNENVKGQRPIGKPTPKVCVITNRFEGILSRGLDVPGPHTVISVNILFVLCPRDSSSRLIGSHAHSSFGMPGFVPESKG